MSPDDRGKMVQWTHAWASKAGERGDAFLTVEKIIVEKSVGDAPRNYDTSDFFLGAYENFGFLNILKTKRPKSEEKLNFLGMWTWVLMNPPKTKLRGDVLGYMYRIP